MALAVGVDSAVRVARWREDNVARVLLYKEGRHPDLWDHGKRRVGSRGGAGRRRLSGRTSRQVDGEAAGEPCPAKLGDNPEII